MKACRARAAKSSEKSSARCGCKLGARPVSCAPSSLSSHARKKFLSAGADKAWGNLPYKSLRLRNKSRQNRAASHLLGTASEVREAGAGHCRPAAADKAESLYRSRGGMNAVASPRAIACWRVRSLSIKALNECALRSLAARSLRNRSRSGMRQGVISQKAALGTRRTFLRSESSPVICYVLSLANVTSSRWWGIRSADHAQECAIPPRKIENSSGSEQSMFFWKQPRFAPTSFLHTHCQFHGVHFIRAKL